MNNEEVLHRKATLLCRFLSWKYGRKVIFYGNEDSLQPHWIHDPLRWADTLEPVTTKQLDDEEAWLVTDGLGPLSKYQPASTEAQE